MANLNLHRPFKFVVHKLWTTIDEDDKVTRAGPHREDNVYKTYTTGKTMAIGEIWIQYFACCVTEQPQPKRRLRIDRSMIGEPMNFRHTGHIGSGDMQTNGAAQIQLSAIQNQMRSKGGYEYAVPVGVPLVVRSIHN